MRKNRMMRLASALLILTMVTTCAISGTFAKYTTSDTASDAARVAKWGIDVAVGGNLFGKYYASNVATENNDSIVAESTNVAGSENVVAPGTKNETGFQVKISGTPEVAYEVTAKTGTEVAGVANEEIFLGTGDWGTMVAVTGLNNATDFSTGDYWKKSGDDFVKATAFEASVAQYYQLHDEVTIGADGYYPIVWTLKKDNAVDNSVTRLDAIASKIKTGVVYQTDVANQASDIEYILTWVWPIEQDGSADQKKVTNTADTILGNLMAGDTTNIVVKKSGDKYSPAEDDGTACNLNVKFAFEVTVTQVD